MGIIRIISYGGIAEVGRSCFMIEDRDHRILLDCGIKLIPKRPSEKPKILNDISRPLRTIDAIILTHGHLDHSGFIPRLFEEGYKGRIYLTPPTNEVLKILYNDMLKLQKEGEKIFGEEGLKKFFKKVLKLDFRKWKKVSNGVRIKFYDSGHVLGASQVLIDWEGTTILYSGDIKIDKTPFHKGAKVPNHEIDLLIIEATNATREVPPREIVVKEFLDDVKKVLSMGGKVLIPSLAFGRSQEILFELLKSRLNEEYPIILDGMLVKINAIYKKYFKKPWIIGEAVKFCKDMGLKWIDEGQNIVRGFEKNGRRREEIAASDEPMIILSTSGMLEGGPIHVYLFHNAGSERNLLALVNYQVPGTLGRQIEEGERHVMLSPRRGKIVEVDLKLRVKKYEFSSHASLRNLVEYVGRINPKKLLIVHSEPPAAKIFADIIKKKYPKIEILNRFEEEAFSLLYDNLFMEYELFRG